MSSVQHVMLLLDLLQKESILGQKLLQSCTQETKHIE